MSSSGFVCYIIWRSSYSKSPNVKKHPNLNMPYIICTISIFYNSFFFEEAGSKLTRQRHFVLDICFAIKSFFSDWFYQYLMVKQRGQWCDLN